MVNTFSTPCDGRSPTHPAGDGIGAGPHCDGQILVTPDMLGLNVDFHPRFVRHYANLAKDIEQAVKEYIDDVRKQNFPSKEESY